MPAQPAPTGAATALLSRPPRAPLWSTRLVFCATGCEEAGLLGMQAFLRAHDTSGWLFLNVDNVGGPATLRDLEVGIVRTWPADTKLVELAARIARDLPDLGLEPAAGPIGLTYDATPVLARGGRALTLVAADDDGVIPNYHWPTDTPENLDLACVEAALESSRELVAAIDRGEAD